MKNLCANEDSSSSYESGDDKMEVSFMGLQSHHDVIDNKNRNSKNGDSNEEEMQVWKLTFKENSFVH